MPLSKKYVQEQLTAADPEDNKSGCRFTTTQALAAYTRTANSITADANGAMADQDGLTPAAGDSFLLRHGASGVDNGLWVVDDPGDGSNPFQLTRRGDADRDEFVTRGMSVRVEEGDRYGQGTGTVFVLTTANPITVNTTALTFEEVVENGGGGSLLEIVNGDFEQVEANRTLLQVGPLDIDDGDLDIEGSLEHVDPPSNYLIERVPARIRRTIPRNDVAHFSGVLQVEGIIDGDGILRDVTPDTPEDLLAKLGEVVPPGHFLVGGTSPVAVQTPAAARTSMGVYSTSEVDSAVSAVSAALSPFAALEPGTPITGAVTAEAGKIYDVQMAATISMPATPNDGDIVGLYSLLVLTVTIDGNGNDVQKPASGSASSGISITMDNSFIYAVFHAGLGRWKLFPDSPSNAFADQPYVMIGTNAIGVLEVKEGEPHLALNTTAVTTATTVNGVLNTTIRFRVNDASSRTLVLPSTGLSDGDRVGFQHWGDASNAPSITLDGNSNLIEGLLDPTGTVPSLTFIMAGSLNIVCRWVAFGLSPARWVIESHQGGMDVLRAGNTAAANAVHHTDGSAVLTRTAFAANNSFFGRVVGNDLQELEYFHAWQTLTNADNETSDNTTGTQTAYQPISATAWRRANYLVWDGASPLVLQGIQSYEGQTEFSALKFILNLSGSDTNTITFEHESVSASVEDRILCPRSQDFVLGPWEVVPIRYDSAQNRWVLLTGITPSSLVYNNGSHCALVGSSAGVVFARTMADNSLLYRATGFVDDLVVGASTIVGRASTGDIAALTAAQVRTIINVEDGADVTDAANVDAAGAVMEVDYDANTILKADSDDTPTALTVGEQTLVGRITAGVITALTAAQVRTLLNVEDGATADQTNSEIQTAYDAGLTEQTLSDGATISYDVSSGRNANVTLGGDRVLNWTNPVAGQRGVVRIIQDGTGTRLITAYQLAGSAANVLFAGGTAPTLTTTNGAQDVLEWYYDGTQLHVRVFSLDSQ